MARHRRGNHRSLSQFGCDFLARRWRFKFMDKVMPAEKRILTSVSICRIASLTLAIAAAFAFGNALHAQDYPVKPIRIIVPSPGGTVDVVARLFIAKLAEKFGQSVFIENRAGAGGNIGAEAVFKAAPDGYTLLAAPPGPLVINKSLYARLAYDPDLFAPVAILATAPQVLVVHSKIRAESLSQLIAYAKANPDRLNYGSAGAGSSLHLAAEMFKAMAGVKIVHVPYKGAGPALADLTGGQVDMMFMDLGAISAHVRSGKLRALGVASEKRNALLAEVPAIRESVPGFNSIFWTGLVGPQALPAAIVNRLSAAVSEVAKQAEIAKRLVELSFESNESTHGEMAVFMKQERDRWGSVIRAIGVTAE
ncbi:MAG: tripartite tricarboxylate transporter substrate binding protein [Betaproteobacteria bacterium]|nr:tripartite tricarboxylate transporter substrate binding protein [Betaproteobacteria bacterium]